MSKKACILYIVLPIFLFFSYSPIPAQAQTIDPATRATLLQQIAALLEQISKLEAQLALQKVAEAPKVSTTRPRDATEDYTIYETFYFGTDFEAIYEVNSQLQLARQDIKTNTRLSDLRIWNIFVDTIGKREAKKFIDEFRVFDRSTSNIGAFVELRRSSNASDFWILGVNEDDFDLQDINNRKQFETLFIHEYAHLLTYDDETILDDFEDDFWTVTDYRHEQSIKNLRGDKLDATLERYYKANEDIFISDYATSNPEEDFAETFTYFVLNNRPKNLREVQYQKVDFMYSFDELVEARNRLRENIDLD